MMESFTTIFLGLLGILAPFLILGSALALCVGFSMVVKMTYNGLIRHRHRLMSRTTEKVRTPKATVAERPIEEPILPPSPNWALVAQCLIWGHCKSHPVEK